MFSSHINVKLIHAEGETSTTSTENTFPQKIRLGVVEILLVLICAGVFSVTTLSRDVCVKILSFLKYFDVDLFVKSIDFTHNKSMY